MAFRRSFRRPFRRRFRKNPYDVQRFSVCDGILFVGSGNCESSTTDMVPLVVGGLFDVAGFGNSLLGQQQDPISRNIVFGGSRFWLEWGIDSQQTAIQEATLPSPAVIWNLHVIWFIAKIPIDPQTLGPAFVPDLWDPTTNTPSVAPMNSGDVQYDLLWTKMDLITLGINMDALNLVGSAVTSVGANAVIPASNTRPVLGGPQIRQTLPYRVKTKRRLSETEGLFFGICSHSGGLATSSNLFTYQIHYDLYGQAALKRAH